MANVNPILHKVAKSTYNQIFNREIIDKVKAFKSAHSQKKIYMMGWGDTSQCLPPIVVDALVDGAIKLGHPETYTGYEEITGNQELKKVICHNYYQKKQGVDLDTSEIFISDGAQTSSANIQELFDFDNIVALQNPTYPYFIEGNLLSGRNEFVYLHCYDSNNFVPVPPNEKVDLIYLCYPNNPTGVVATTEKLKAFVDYAIANQAVIIFDAVYAPFITTPNTIRSIYEIKGAKKCAIEIGSFSKMAGFTGLRLGWSVVPHNLTIDRTTPSELNHLWRIRQSIKSWGASSIVQKGGIAALSESGQKEYQEKIGYYLKNASILKKGLEEVGLKCFGGVDSPYIWLKTPQEMTSWRFFEKLLHEAGIVGIPGCLFGSTGEGYLRLSGLGLQEEVKEAVESLYQLR